MTMLPLLGTCFNRSIYSVFQSQVIQWCNIPTTCSHAVDTPKLQHFIRKTLQTASDREAHTCGVHLSSNVYYMYTCASIASRIFFSSSSMPLGGIPTQIIRKVFLFIFRHSLIGCRDFWLRIRTDSRDAPSNSVNMFAPRQPVVWRLAAIFCAAIGIVSAANSVYILDSGEQSVALVADGATINDNAATDFETPKWSQHNSLLFGIFVEIIRGEPSTRCGQDVGTIVDSIRRRESWALKSTLFGSSTHVTF